MPHQKAFIYVLMFTVSDTVKAIGVKIGQNFAHVNGAFAVYLLLFLL